MATAEDISRVLRQAGEPLSVQEIAARTNGDVRECDSLLWGDPGLFLWQPGHKWTAATSSKSRSRPGSATSAPDARSRVLSPSDPQELRAITLSSGLTISVNRRPLDSDAFFSVRSAGSVITLTINSTHELFSDLPMPFENDRDESEYRKLAEVLLAAWALYEDGLPGGSTKRATQDARLLWGRRAIEMLRDSDQ